MGGVVKPCECDLCHHYRKQDPSFLGGWRNQKEMAMTADERKERQRMDEIAEWREWAKAGKDRTSGR